MQHHNIPGNQNIGRHLRLAAYFYSATKRTPAALEFYRINEVSGGKQFIETVYVADKREARRLAENKGFTPWNF